MHKMEHGVGNRGRAAGRGSQVRALSAKSEDQSSLTPLIVIDTRRYRQQMERFQTMRAAESYANALQSELQANVDWRNYQENLFEYQMDLAHLSGFQMGMERMEFGSGWNAGDMSQWTVEQQLGFASKNQTLEAIDYRLEQAANYVGNLSDRFDNWIVDNIDNKYALMSAGFYSAGVQLAADFISGGISGVRSFTNSDIRTGIVNAVVHPIDTTRSAISHFSGLSAADQVLGLTQLPLGIVTGSIGSRVGALGGSGKFSGSRSVIIPESGPSPSVMAYSNISPSKLESFSYKDFGEIKPGLYYQAQRDGQKGTGEFFSNMKPLNSMDAEEMFNIKVWGNNAEQLGIFEVKPGLQAWNGGVKGGSGTQVYIPKELHSEFLKQVDTEALFVNQLKWMTRP